MRRKGRGSSKGRRRAAERRRNQRQMEMRANRKQAEVVVGQPEDQVRGWVAAGVVGAGGGSALAGCECEAHRPSSHC